MNKNRQYALDGIKGIAACIVAFAWHYQHFGVLGEESPFYSVMPISYKYGWLMVELFFMLSGFGMMCGYKEKIQSGNVSFGQFMFKRIGKLYPLHLLTLFMVTILEIAYIKRVGTTFVYPNFDAYHFFLNLFGIQNGFLGTEWSFNSPSWCISIFLILYSLFYYLIYTSKKDETIIVKFLVATLLGAGLLKSDANYPILNELVARGLICFSIGVLLYYIYENRHKFQSGLLGIGSLLVCVGIYALVRWGDGNHIGDLQMLFIIGFGPALILGILLCKPLNKVFGLKPLVCLGKISMSIYLLHFPIQCIIKLCDLYFGLQLNYGTKTVWAIYVVTVLVVSILHEKLIAKKMKKVFSFWIKK